MYKDPILRRIREILEKYGPKELRGRWDIGDSFAVPKALFPHGFIAYDAENVRDIANTQIRDNYSIVITVAVDMTKEFGSPSERADSHEHVVGILSGKDSETYLLKPDSVLGALRAHQDLDTSKNLYAEVDGSETNIEYGLGLEKRGPGIVTAEGVLRFQLTHDQVKPV